MKFKSFFLFCFSAFALGAGFVLMLLAFIKDKGAGGPFLFYCFLVINYWIVVFFYDVE
jgi:hypothetical protein